MYIYSTYSRPMLAHSPIEFYPVALGGFHLGKRDISNYHRPTAGVSLSEHVMTVERRWRVCAGADDRCVGMCK